MEGSPSFAPPRGRVRGFMDTVLQEFPARFFENWAEHTDIAILITDPEGAVRWSNPAFTKMCLYPMHEIVGRRPGRFLGGPLTEDSARDVIRRAIREGKSCLTRITNYKKDATPYVAQIHMEPIRNNLGELLGFIALEQDVTTIDKKERDISELSASIYNQLLTRMDAAPVAPSAS
jgi:PAS domain S-box-containing protein